MPTLMTGLGCALATGLAVAAGAPTYAVADPGHDRDVYLSFDRLDAAGLPLLDAPGGGDVVGEVSSVAGGEVTAGPDRSSSGHSLRMERFRPDQPASPAVVVL